jgi:hypothetical protein
MEINEDGFLPQIPGFALYDFRKNIKLPTFPIYDLFNEREEEDCEYLFDNICVNSIADNVDDDDLSY